GDLDQDLVADHGHVGADAELAAQDADAGVEAGRLLLGHRVQGDLVDVHVHQHRPGDTVDAQLAGHFQPALADRLDAGAGEGGDGVVGDVEEIGGEQVLVQLPDTGADAVDGDLRLDAGTGRILGVVDDAAFDAVEAAGDVREAEVAVGELDLGVGGVDHIGVGRQDGGGAGQQGDSEQVTQGHRRFLLVPGKP